MWSNGLQALVPLINTPDFHNLPPVLDIVEPIIKASPSALQFDLQELIIALYKASPDETIFFLTQIVKKTKSPLLAVSLRRMLPELPDELQKSLREVLRDAK
jgi:hypothetical protein